MRFLLENNVDKRLAFHVSSLFARDPIPAYSTELIESMVNDAEQLSHFENL